jgi:fluoride exporter
MNWQAMIAIGIGGGIGAMARYAIGDWFKRQEWVGDFSWATFAINVAGSLMLGIVAALCKDRSSMSFLLFGTGFCGGFTTFSTFSLEVAETIRKGRWDIAAIYVLSSVVAGVAAFAIAAWVLDLEGT